MIRIAFRWLGIAGISILLLIALALIALVLQARVRPAGDPRYVALGSSFAAGAGLGPLQPGSPTLCARSSGGYPTILARTFRLPVMDMSCGGATAAHVLHGGQFLQHPQIDAVSARTRLVTITVGGNDVGYVGDLSMLALAKSDGIGGWLARRLWSGPKAEAQRDYASLERTLTAIIRTAQSRAPAARIMVATYPTILPPTGTCPALALNPAEADRMRITGDRLAAVTRAAAQAGGAVLVDMHRLGAAHHACSRDPWVHGWSALGDAPFHPTAQGARATVEAIAAALPSPTGIAAIGEDDAARQQAGGVGGEKVND